VIVCIVIALSRVGTHSLASEAPARRHMGRVAGSCGELQR